MSDNGTDLSGLGLIDDDPEQLAVDDSDESDAEAGLTTTSDETDEVKS